MPTLDEASCCYKGVAVNDLGLGQVHLMTKFAFCELIVWTELSYNPDLNADVPCERGVRHHILQKCWSG